MLLQRVVGQALRSPLTHSHAAVRITLMPKSAMGEPDPRRLPRTLKWTVPSSSAGGAVAVVLAVDELVDEVSLFDRPGVGRESSDRAAAAAAMVRASAAAVLLSPPERQWARDSARCRAQTSHLLREPLPACTSSSGDAIARWDPGLDRECLLPTSSSNGICWACLPGLVPVAAGGSALLSSDPCRSCGRPCACWS